FSSRRRHTRWPRDWSSDVCSSDLARGGRYAEALAHRFLAVVLELDRLKALRFHTSKTPAEYVGEARLTDAGRATLAGLVAQLYQIGRASCRERVERWVVAGSLKNK